MKIRPASLHDAPELARVHIQCWREAYAGIIAPEYLSRLSFEDRLAGWKQQLAPDYHGSRFNLVAEDPRLGVVGFSSGGAQRDEAYQARFDGELWGLYLLSDFQSRGIGGSLFNAIKAQLKSQGYQGMLTWVLRENPACGFYEKMGGEPVGSKKIMIDREHDEIAYGWAEI